MTNTLGPLPEFAAEFKPRWPGDTGGFSAAQMEAERQRCYELGVAQERERAANLAESWSEYHSTITSIGPRLACAIRQEP